LSYPKKISTRFFHKKILHPSLDKAQTLCFYGIYITGNCYLFKQEQIPAKNSINLIFSIT